MYKLSLPMYQHAGVQNAILSWGQSVMKKVADQQESSGFSWEWAEAGDDLLAHWRQAELLLSQTCGFPLRKWLHSDVQVLGTLRYAVDGCRGSDYSSWFVAAASNPGRKLADFQGSRFVCNGFDSQSGFNALRLALEDLSSATPFFSESIVSGGHRLSMLEVANNRADICSIDCVTFAILKQYEPELVSQLKIVGQSDYFPGLPLITSNSTESSMVSCLRQAIVDTIADKSMADVMQMMFIEGFDLRDKQEYLQRIKLPDAEMLAL